VALFEIVGDWSIRSCADAIPINTVVLVDVALTITELADLIFGLDGDDVITAGKGNDCIFAGQGNDVIFGNDGDDEIFGGQGNDVLRGQSGNDSLSGGSGTNVIDGGDDYDFCNAESIHENDLIVKCEK